MCQCKFALMATAAVFLAQFWHTHCAKMVKIGLKMYFDSGSESLYLRDFCGGGDQDRTDDLLIANQTLSQLSYTPTAGAHPKGKCALWEGQACSYVSVFLNGAIPAIIRRTTTIQTKEAAS